MERHILFYSKYCSHCKEFINHLYKTDYFNKFEKISVDNNRGKIPKEITSVPAIIVPRFPRPMFGEEVFRWLDGFASMQSSEPKQEAEKKPDTVGDSKVDHSAPVFGSVMPNSGTYSGFSDNFSFLGDTNPQEHSFQFLGGNGDFKIQTPQEGEFDRSGKSDELSKSVEQMIEARNREMPQPPART